MRDQSGFTLIELIMVLLVIGILAIYAVPKLDVSVFRQTGFFLQAMSAVRYAQKQAIASGCNVKVDINASGCNLTWSAGAAHCLTIAINSPSNGSTNFCKGSTPETAPGLNPNLNLDGTFIFDNIGRPSPDNQYELDIGSRKITIEAETGYTHEN